MASKTVDQNRPILEFNVIQELEACLEKHCVHMLQPDFTSASKENVAEVLNLMLDDSGVKGSVKSGGRNLVKKAILLTPH